MKRKLTTLLITLLLIFTLTGCFIVRAQDPYESPATYEQIRLDMLQDVEPSVIAVQTEEGFGSGVIYQKDETDTEGEYLYYALTNYHVVEDGGEMKIYHGDDLTVVPIVDYQGNEIYDVAVVRFISELNFRVQEIIPISQNIVTEIVAGQDVYAIGTPNDLANFNYITSGVVSLATQTYNGIPGLAIMHNAELNPGNSGGPLFNLNGDVIGLNVAKDTWIPTETGEVAAEGLNYALNMNTIAPVVRGFIEDNYIDVVRTPKLGVTVANLTDYLTEHPEEASRFDTGAQGIVVIGFDPTRNAIDVLEEYDLIIKINATTVTTIEEMLVFFTDVEFGDTLSVTVVRKEGTSFVEYTYDIELA